MPKRALGAAEDQVKRRPLENFFHRDRVEVALVKLNEKSIRSLLNLTPKAGDGCLQITRRSAIEEIERRWQASHGALSVAVD